MARICIIEDNFIIRKLILRIVKSSDIDIEEICEASNGIEALQSINEHKIDIVFTDYNMPKMTGIEFAKTLHNTAMHQNVPIVMITAHDNESLKKEASDAGIGSFITKPFNPEQITNELRNCLATG